MDTSPSAPQGVAVVQHRLVTWDPNGAPMVTSAPMLTKPQIQTAISAAAALPFHDPLGLEPEFAGMCNLEVMLIKMARSAAGTSLFGEREALLDRLIGKPKQSSEVTKVTFSYEDYLSKLAEEGGAAPLPSQRIVEAEVETSLFSNPDEGIF